MSDRRFASGIMAQLALSSMICTVVIMIMIIESSLKECYPFVLIVFAPAVYLIDRIFLIKERTMNQLIFLNAVLGVILLAIIHFIDGWSGFAAAVFMVAFIAWLGYFGAKYAVKAPKMGEMVMYLDFACVILVVFIAFLSAKRLEIILAIPAIVGFVAAIMGVIVCRINRKMGIKEWGAIGIVFAAIVGIASLFMSFVADSAGKGLVALWNAIIGIAKAILDFIMRVMLFLASLVKEPEAPPLEMEQPAVMPDVGHIVEEVKSVTDVILIVTGIILVIAFVFLAFFIAYKKRVGGEKAVKVGGRTQTRGRILIFAGLRRLFAKIKDWMHIRIFLLKNRNRAVGLFYYIIQKSKRSTLAKSNGETPREFLTRLKISCIQDDDKDSAFVAAMDNLIDMVERAIYAAPNSKMHISYENSAVNDAALVRKRIKTKCRNLKIKRTFNGFKFKKA